MNIPEPTSTSTIQSDNGLPPVTLSIWEDGPFSLAHRQREGEADYNAWAVRTNHHESNSVALSLYEPWDSDRPEVKVIWSSLGALNPQTVGLAVQAAMNFQSIIDSHY